MAAYRQVCVQIHVGKAQSYVAVIARTVEDGRRRDHLVHRAAVDTVDAATVAVLLRVAGDECHDAADRLV